MRALLGVDIADHPAVKDVAQVALEGSHGLLLGVLVGAGVGVDLLVWARGSQRRWVMAMRCSTALTRRLPSSSSSSARTTDEGSASDPTEQRVPVALIDNVDHHVIVEQRTDVGLADVLRRQLPWRVTRSSLRGRRVSNYPPGTTSATYPLPRPSRSSQHTTANGRSHHDQRQADEPDL